MLNASITPHREFLPAAAPEQKLFLMLKLRPNREANDSLPPTAFTFVIDTSGSMREVVTGGKSKIDLVIEALHKLVSSGKLTDSDRIAVIQFDDSASTLIELTPATQTDKIHSAIDRLDEFSGGTHMALGMEKALDLLSTQNMTIRRAVIFTDGQTFDDQQCRELAANDFSKNGIQITNLGVGEFNEELLLNLSDATGGRTCHVVSGNATGIQVAIEDLPKSIIDEFSQAQNEVINNLQLSLQLVKGVTLTRLIRAYPELAEFLLNSQPYNIGYSVGNDETIFILELTIASRSDSRVRIARLGLTYEVPGKNMRQELPPLDAIVQFVSGQSAAQVDREVMSYVQQCNISQLVNEATRLAPADPELAEKKLEAARRMTQKIGNTRMTQNLNEGIDELRKTRQISPDRRKTLKIGAKGKTVKMSNDIHEDGFSDDKIRQYTGT